MSLAEERLSAARAAMARVYLDALPDAQVGDITLRPEQRRILARAERALRDRGGCLVGEDVGRGKTFIALALARRWRNPLIVAPAALRTTWSAAQLRARIACEFISHDALSRRRTPAVEFDALIVDESHHFRNPATTRYEALTRLAAAVPVMLLSATPMQNRARDLAAQVALFYGERALALSAESLSRFVIRGDDAPHGGMPIVAAPEWLPVAADDGAVLAALLDLPPPPRPLDGGDAGTLRIVTLVRAWASSRAALEGMLRSRRRMTTAIAQGIEAGRAPTRRETREWRAADDVVQLGLAPLLMQHSTDATALVSARAQIAHEDVAHERLRATLAASVDPDRSRIAAISALRASCPDCRIVAFSEYASTVSRYFDALRTEPGVGLLTARTARIASGVIARKELLERFAPLAQGTRPHAAHDAVTLLLATDLISEGVNLQDASIVLHLDLPWNPARLAQRVGRVRRPGGATVVRAFLLAPPAKADALLAADARLRRKLDNARQVIGPGFAVLPRRSALHVIAAASTPTMSASAVAEGQLVDALQAWATDRATPNDLLAIGAIEHPTRGWLAALDDGRLIGCLHETPTESVEHLLTLTRIADRPARPTSGGEVAHALGTLHAWMSAEDLLRSCGVTDDAGPQHHRADSMLRQLVSRARRYEQAQLTALASRIRHHLANPLPLGAELAIAREVQSAAQRPQEAVAILASALEEIDVGARSRGVARAEASARRVVALIVVGPTARCDGVASNDTRDDCASQPSRALEP